MPTTICSRCEVRIVDDASMITRGGKTFCCENCAATVFSEVSLMAVYSCAHCHVPITDPSTRAELGGVSYCCNNCAVTTPGAASFAVDRAVPMGADLN